MMEKNIKVLIPVIIFLIFSLPQINDSYWLDELYTINNAKTLNDLFIDVHPPIYTLFMHGWIRIFGDTEIWTRMPSLIAGGLAVFLITKMSFNAGILISLSQIVHDVGATTRSYAFLLLFGAIALYFVHHNKKNVFIPTILMSLTHYYGLFAGLGIHAHDIYVKRNKEAYANAALWLGVCSAYILFHITRMNFDAGGWIAEIRVIELFSGALGSTYPCAALIWLLIIWQMPLMERIVFSFGLITPILLSIIRPSLYAHYTIALVPFSMMLIAKKFKGRQYMIILMIFILLLLLSPPTFMSQDYREAAEMVSSYENAIVISLIVDQGYYFDATKVCEHPVCVEWAMLEEHDTIWLLNGAFADADYYAQPLLDDYEEEILWFDLLEVRKYTPVV
jgi:uncharacterized membrane protein